MNLQEIALAYQSIYLTEETNEEVNIEDLSQEEVDSLVEELVEEFLEEGFSLDDIEEAFNDYVQEQELITEARAAKKARAGSDSYEQAKAKVDAKEKEKAEKAAARKAARVANVETKKKERAGALATRGGSLAKRESGGGAVDTRVKPVTVKVIGSSAKKEVAKRRDKTGSVGSGASGTVRSKGGKMGGDGSKGTSLPAGKTEKGGAIVKRNEPIGAKAEVKSGVRKALTYRMSKKDISRSNRRDDISAAPKSKTDRAKDAASAVRVGARNAAKSLKKKAGSALGKLAAKLSEEGGELDTFDLVAAYMIDEGFASDFDGATALMTKLSSELVDDICESQLQLLDEEVEQLDEISAQLAHTASMKADEVRRKAALAGDKETAAKKAAQASRIYKGVGPRRAKERKEGN